MITPPIDKPVLIEGKSRRERSVTRADLADAAYRCMRSDRRASHEIVEDVLDEIVLALSHGEDVLLSGFGKFSVRVKGERTGRNPKTRVEALIKARRIVSFRPSASLRARVISVDPSSTTVS